MNNKLTKDKRDEIVETGVMYQVTLPGDSPPDDWADVPESVFFTREDAARCFQSAPKVNVEDLTEAFNLGQSLSFIHTHDWDNSSFPEFMEKRLVAKMRGMGVDLPREDDDLVNSLFDILCESDEIEFTMQELIDQLVVDQS